MSVYFHQEEQHILVQGKTYPYRDLMRTLGGQYQAADKIWLLPSTPENLERITELCRSVGGGRSKAATQSPKLENETPVASSSAPASVTERATQEKPLDSLADGMTISELMQKTQLAIAQAYPRSIWVLGEIQNLKLHASGTYFQLADIKEGASKSATMTVNATLWRSQYADLERKLGASTLRELLQDGMRVRVLVDVSLYKDRGQISLQVQSLDPNFTKGSLALAREKLLRELRAKGIDRLNKSLKVPAFPFHVGLISAPDSRARSDFLDQLQVYGFPGHVSFYAAQMQGEKTLDDVVKGLQHLTQQGCDLIVVTRGGGSAADLRWFDSPEIAYAIAQCPLPVIAAIGHHEDVCIAEEICFQREKTPTAAADFILSLFQRTRERLEQLSLGLSRSLQERMRLLDHVLFHARERLLYASQQVLHGYREQIRVADNQLDTKSQRRLLEAQNDLMHLRNDLHQRLNFRWQNLENRRSQLAQVLYTAALQPILRRRHAPEQLGQQLQASSERRLYQEKEKLYQWERTLVQRDPKPWMAEGWTQLIGPKGRILSIETLTPGMKLKAPILDGLLHLSLDAIEKKPSHATKDT